MVNYQSLLLCLLVIVFLHGEAKSDSRSYEMGSWENMSGRSASSVKIYKLKKKKPASSPSPLSSTTRKKQLNNPSSSSESFTIPILPSSFEENQGFEIMPALSTDMISASSDGGIEMEEAIIDQIKNNKIKMRTRTPIMVSGEATSKKNSFQSNIPLPSNPYIEETQKPKHYSRPSSTSKENTNHVVGKHMMTKSNTKNKAVPPPPPPPPSPEVVVYTPMGIQTYKENEEEVYPDSPNSRADNWLTSSFSKLFGSFQLPKISHYTKPGSGRPAYQEPSSLSSLLSGPLQMFSESREPPLVKVRPPPSAPYPVPVSSSSFNSRKKDQFVSLLSQLHKIEDIKQSLPPKGSYSPYGERTIIMMKFPGLPERKRVVMGSSSSGSFSLSSLLPGGGVKPITVSKDDWMSPSDQKHKMKDPDTGVVISQNYILQPDVSMNSNYFESEDDSQRIHQLAKALAERNQIMNEQARLDGKNKRGDSGMPPFVIIQLETYSRKQNKSTNFGFDEDIETSYSNGTVIYPTLDDPEIMASTRFEFQNVKDIEHIFDRPLAGIMEHEGGRMKPIIPLGLVDIQNYLRLVHSVHKDIHDGGRGKVDELRKLSYSLERKGMEGYKPMTDWEMDKVKAMYKENWLHTSTIGVRSLSDYPPIPPKLPVPYPI